VSVAAPPSPGGSGTASTSAGETAREACPLCGAPLHPEQEWCLSCGAAARTRLAASPGWRGPIVALVVVLVLCLGVLTGSLVKLAGGTPTAATQTTTVTTNAAATTTYPKGFLPGSATTLTTTPTTGVPSTIPTRSAPPTTTTTPNPTASTTSPLTTLGKIKGKVKGPVGGINLERLKKSIAERLSKAGPTEK
jgi:hypothetical protein